MINLSSTVRLASGYTMPRLGFGVYQSTDAKASVLEALKAGYRLFDIVHYNNIFSISSINRHVDSAQVYRNEAEVAEAIRASGVPREDIFVSKCRNYLLLGIRAYLRLVLLQPLNVCQETTDMNQLLEVSTSR